MPHDEFNLGQMLRDADILSVEDLERAVTEAQIDDESLAEVAHKNANWDTFKQLLTTDIFARGMGKSGRALNEVLQNAGWMSVEQLALVLEATEKYGKELGQRLVEAGVIEPDDLARAWSTAETSDRSLWRVLVNSGHTDI